MMEVITTSRSGRFSRSARARVPDEGHRWEVQGEQVGGDRAFDPRAVDLRGLPVDGFQTRDHAVGGSFAHQSLTLTELRSQYSR